METQESSDKVSDHDFSHELTHLKKRIERIMNSIKLSPGSLCSPVVWEENCINAVSNCINEWRSIVSFHHLSTYPNNSNNYSDVDAATIKQMSLDIFMLVQQAMQCGPLSGSRPAYFKRCGSDVSKVAHKFLQDVFAGDMTRDLLFTERQSVAITKWTREAERASAQDQEPSKTSALKQLQIATGMKTKKIFKD